MVRKEIDALGLLSRTGGFCAPFRNINLSLLDYLFYPVIPAGLGLKHTVKTGSSAKSLLYSHSLKGFLEIEFVLNAEFREFKMDLGVSEEASGNFTPRGSPELFKKRLHVIAVRKEDIHEVLVIGIRDGNKLVSVPDRIPEILHGVKHVHLLLCTVRKGEFLLPSGLPIH